MNVTLVLKDNFSKPGIAAVVRRTPGANGVILIAVKRATLSPELLSAAIAAVSASAGKYGEHTDKQVSVYIKESARLRRIAPDEHSRLQNTLSQLQSATPQVVPGVGRVPAITIAVNY